jgi:hypothetical protein
VTAEKKYWIIDRRGCEGDSVYAFDTMDEVNDWLSHYTSYGKFDRMYIDVVYGETIDWMRT